jgi:predicted ATPase
VLALAFACAYAMAYGRSEGTVLVIDEPEANLHPLAQQWLASRLKRLAAPGLEVVVTTHSPHFVDLARPENLVLVSKAEGSRRKTPGDPERRWTRGMAHPPWDSAPGPLGGADPASRETVGGSVVEVEPPF